MQDFTQLLAEPRRDSRGWRYGTITGTDPVLVRLDGETIAAPATALAPVLAGDRVLVQLHARQLIVHGPVTVTAATWEPVQLIHSAFEVYSSDQVPEYTVRGGVVYVRGAARCIVSDQTIGSGQNWFGQIPPELAPGGPLTFVTQVSQSNRACLQVDESGRISASRYGPTESHGVNLWIPLSVLSWPI